MYNLLGDRRQTITLISGEQCHVTQFYALYHTSIKFLFSYIVIGGEHSLQNLIFDYTIYYFFSIVEHLTDNPCMHELFQLWILAENRSYVYSVKVYSHGIKETNLRVVQTKSRCYIVNTQKEIRS